MARGKENFSEMANSGSDAMLLNIENECFQVRRMRDMSMSIRGTGVVVIGTVRLLYASHALKLVCCYRYKTTITNI